MVVLVILMNVLCPHTRVEIIFHARHGTLHAARLCAGRKCPSPRIDEHAVVVHVAHGRQRAWDSFLVRDIWSRGSGSRYLFRNGSPFCKRFPGDAEMTQGSHFGPFGLNR